MTEILPLDTPQKMSAAEAEEAFLDAAIAAWEKNYEPDFPVERAALSEDMREAMCAAIRDAARKAQKKPAPPADVSVVERNAAYMGGLEEERARSSAARTNPGYDIDGEWQHKATSETDEASAKAEMIRIRKFMLQARGLLDDVPMEKPEDFSDEEYLEWMRGHVAMARTLLYGASIKTSSQ